MNNSSHPKPIISVSKFQGTEGKFLLHHRGNPLGIYHATSKFGTGTLHRHSDGALVLYPRTLDDAIEWATNNVMWHSDI